MANDIQLPVYSLAEEIAHSVSHGVGVVLAIVGLALLLPRAALHGTPLDVTAAVVFGATLILLYLASTLYHAVTGKRPPDSPSRMVKDEMMPARDAALAAYRGSFLRAIDRALALVIDQRPQSIAAWRAAINSLFATNVAAGARAWSWISAAAAG